MQVTDGGSLPQVVEEDHNTITSKEDASEASSQNSAAHGVQQLRMQREMSFSGKCAQKPS